MTGRFALAGPIDFSQIHRTIPCTGVQCVPTRKGTLIRFLTSLERFLMKYDPKNHSRGSVRLDGYNYSHPGIYLITVCTFHREEIFGSVINDEIVLSPLGRIVRNEWFHSVEIHKEIQLFKTEFVIMPNHLHGIVWLMGGEVFPLDVRFSSWPNSPASVNRTQRPLGSFMESFKACVSDRANRELNIFNIWEGNYFENIIRNETQLEQTRVYIHTNPRRWQEDKLHPSAPTIPF